MNKYIEILWRHIGEKGVYNNHNPIKILESKIFRCGR